VTAGRSPLCPAVPRHRPRRVERRFPVRNGAVASVRPSQHAHRPAQEALAVTGPERSAPAREESRGTYRLARREPKRR